MKLTTQLPPALELTDLQIENVFSWGTSNPDTVHSLPIEETPIQQLGPLYVYVFVYVYCFVCVSEIRIANLL